MTITARNTLAGSARYRQPTLASPSASALGLEFGDILRHGDARSKRLLTPQPIANTSTLDVRLFQALANAKIWTSQVAMRLDRASRDRYFKQLDRLHDLEEWFEGDRPVDLESYKGFIRFMLIVRGNSKPAMALTSSGRLVAVWLSGGRKLVVEFIDSDRLQWLVSCGDDDRTAGKANLTNIVERLQPYNPEAWFEVG